MSLEEQRWLDGYSMVAKHVRQGVVDRHWGRRAIRNALKLGFDSWTTWGRGWADAMLDAFGC